MAKDSDNEDDVFERLILIKKKIRKHGKTKMSKV
jgi:hypothetical protein